MISLCRGNRADRSDLANEKHSEPKLNYVDTKFVLMEKQGMIQKLNK